MSKDSVRVAENTILSLGNTLAGLIGTVFLSILISRLLGPERLGKYHTVLWAVGVVDLLVDMGVSKAVTKYVAEHDGKGEKDVAAAIVRFSIILRVVIALVMTAALILGAGALARFFKTPEAKLFFWIAALSIIPNTLQILLASTLRGVQRYHYATIFTATSAPINLGASAAVLVGGLGVAGLLAWRVVLLCLGFLYYLWAVKRELPLGNPKPMGKSLRAEVLRFGWAVMMMNVLEAIVWQRSEVFFLGKFSTMDQVGFYSLSFGFTFQAMELIGGPLTSVLMPIQSRAHGAKDTEQLYRIYKESLRYMSIAILPMAMGGIVLARPLTQTLYGKDYLPMVTVLMILFTSASLGRIGTAFSSIFYSVGRVGVLIKLTIIYAIINVTLDFILIPRYHAIGAAVANSSTQIIALIPWPILLYRYYHFAFPARSLLKILANTLSMGFVLWFMRNTAYGILPLILVVVFGVLIYGAGCIIWRVIEEQDIVLLRELTFRVPVKMRTAYTSLINTIERMLTR